MSTTTGMWLLLLLLTYIHHTSANDCVNSIQRMTTCLYYVTGHNPNPTPDCCDAVEDMREKNPLCLCRFIEVVRRGGPEVSNLGIEASRLDDIPAACHMKNTSTSACSKLLGDSNTTSSSGHGAAHSSSSKTTSGGVSKAVVLHIEAVAATVAVAVSILLSFVFRF